MTRALTYREKPRPSQNDGAHTASAVLSATSSSPPVSDDEGWFNFDDDFVKEFAFTGLVVGSGARALHNNADIFTMLVDSGASDHLVDDDLIP